MKQIKTTGKIKLTKGKRKAEVFRLLDEGYSGREIKGMLVIGNDTMSALMKEHTAKKQKEMAIISKEDERKIQLINKYDSLEPAIENLPQKLDNVVQIASGIENKIDDFDTLLNGNLLKQQIVRSKELEVKKKALNVADELLESGSRNEKHEVAAHVIKHISTDI